MTRLRLPLACLRLPLKCLRLPLAASSFGDRRWIARCAVSAFFVAALSKAVLRVAQFCDWSGATASLFEELCSPGGLHGWQLIVPQPRTSYCGACTRHIVDHVAEESASSHKPLASHCGGNRPSETKALSPVDDRSARGTLPSVRSGLGLRHCPSFGILESQIPSSPLTQSAGRSTRSLSCPHVRPCQET